MRPLVWVLVGLVLLGAPGCSRDKRASAPAAGAPVAGAPAAATFRIGLMTGTTTQAAEDFRAGEQVERQYPDRVRHITFPDDFLTETETVIAQLAGLAADPEVRVILVAQAIPGSVAAARRIREARPDILIGFVDPHEDPDSACAACDIAIQPDEPARGVEIVEAARRMGALHLVHYSFPRHLSQPMIARRRAVMARECAELGMGFHPVATPDPAGDGGLSAAQQFILEDVPRRLGELGPATAFFGTGDALQEPMIRAILAARAGYFVEQDLPAPTQGYPAALGMKIPSERANDIAFIDAENRRLIAEAGMSGHFGTWAQPVDAVAIRALSGLLVDSVDGKAGIHDSATVARYLAREAGGPVRLRRYAPGSNHWLVMLDHVTY